jgi:hypothetical protein
MNGWWIGIGEFLHAAVGQRWGRRMGSLYPGG